MYEDQSKSNTKRLISPHKKAYVYGSWREKEPSKANKQRAGVGGRVLGRSHKKDDEEKRIQTNHKKRFMTG